MIKTGIYGGTGYMGGEAFRILHEHPEADVAWVTSRSETDPAEVHPNFYGTDYRFVKPDQITDCDVVFVAAPTGVAQRLAADLPQTKIIDMGADFRLKNRDDWERIYGKEHTNWLAAEEAVYGIPELHRSEILQSRVVANPGCFSSSVILAMAPFVKNGLVQDNTITVSGLSGTAGMGADASMASHHPEIANSILCYNAVDHRHSYEMEQELELVAGDSVTVHFTPAYVPISRGILSLCSFTPTKKVSRDSLLEITELFYQNEFFVKVFDRPFEQDVSWQYKPYPQVFAVSGTNYCHIGLDYDPRRNRAIVFSVLDSIGKGGAHAAVQNMNLLFGLDETTGLTRLGNHPY